MAEYTAPYHEKIVPKLKQGDIKLHQCFHHLNSSQASEIRASLNNPEMAVMLLAELLTKINNADRGRQNFNNWKNLSEETRKSITKLFLGAKDDDALSGDGQLCGTINGAWDMVQKSGLFPPTNHNN
ncbi:hypothetical protein FACS189427_08250 [Planctomycetales bacterium]|nr:hypothetical protein FACS189427_08250 [Planctomycetales bacterium]